MLRNTQWPFSAYIPEHYNNILYVYQDLEMVEISHFAGALTGTSTCVAVATPRDARFDLCPVVCAPGN